MMIISAGFQNIDMLMVKHYFAGTDAGIYGAAFVLARSMGALVTPFTTLMLPLLTTLHEQGKRIAATFARVSVYFLGLATIPVVLFWLWPDEIIAALYGHQFAGAGSLLLLITVVRLLGYLGHMIALAGAATNSFRFLYAYAPALAAQTAALCIWHESLLQIALIMLVGQAATLALLAGSVLARAQQQHPTAETSS